MRIESDNERLAVAQTLKEVTEKLEEALRLARELEDERAHGGEPCKTNV